MRLLNLRTIVVVAAAALGVACADAPSAPRVDASTADLRSSCPASVGDLIGQARNLLGPRAIFFIAIRGKLENLEHLRRFSRPRNVQERAHDVVETLLKLRDAGRVRGTPEQLAALINGIYCLAGINIRLESSEDAFFIEPTDQPQVIVGLDSAVGVSLPGTPVSEPSILRIERMDGRLNTKLDQYPGFVRITLLNNGGTALARRATITVCAEGAPSPEVANRLRLGHGINETGFEITPEPTAGDPAPANLDCAPTPSGLFGRVMQTVRETFAPRTLEASASVNVRRFGGGVSGTVTEFSPFAPVDPELSFGGGVSGTVTEFSRDAMMMSAFESAATANCLNIPLGTNLPADCQPTVTVQTFNGTLLQNVPVDWRVNTDALGRIAPRSGNLDAISCGASGTTAATTTSLNGNAGVCWLLGGVGVNTIVARARAGGDAPAGVTFVNGNTDSVTFNINVTAVTLQVTQGQGALIPFGTSTTAEVRAVDASGAPVAGVHVNWTATGGTVSPATAVTGANGLATVSWTLGEGANTLSATIRNAPGSSVTLSGTGKVTPPPTPGQPVEITVVSGDGQSGPAGAALASPLVVQLRDAAGVPVPGATVFWVLNSGSGALSATSSTSDANGRASVTFSPGVGTSQVKAFINAVGFYFVYFNAAGVAP